MIRALALLIVGWSALAQTDTQRPQQPPPIPYPNQKEGDWVTHDFTFKSGEKLADLRLHYVTVGTPHRNAAGHVDNAVLVMHGTGGTGKPFLGAGFGGELFRKGQSLDAETHYIILPDAIGHGGSSKPSNGMKMKFPHYTYDDMVRGQYLLVHDGLGVDHLRLVMGTSMGAMHTWVWGEMYPDFMDALMPLASAPVEIAGRNRMFRAMIMQAIKGDPDWNNGEYTKPPVNGLMAAEYALWMMTSSAMQLHKTNPTHDKSDAAVAALRRRAANVDANDMLYHYDCSTDYNPSPNLDKIQAPLWAVNSADDEVNPPELGILEREIKKVKNGRYILIPTSDETRGHGTHSRAVVWKNYLVELLKLTEPKSGVLLNPRDDFWRQHAPEAAKVRVATTQGDFVIQLHRDWAPTGVDRFYNLVRAGFYNDSRFYRVIRGDFVQFGIAGDPEVAGVWRDQTIQDDPKPRSNTANLVAFAMIGKDQRTTQIYINLKDNSRRDPDGFSPLGEVVSGMDVVNKLYNGYGERSGGGVRNGMQGPVFEGGNAYMDVTYPKLDKLLAATVGE